MLKPQTSSPSFRRQRAYVSILGITQLHLRNPMIIALWSAIFPGFGHMLLSKFFCGMIFFIWEVFINLKSHMNVSIYYTFTGNFELAKIVLDKEWLMLYIPTYLFAIWDSYRTAEDINQQFVLAAREDAPVPPLVMHTLGLNHLDKGSPWVGAVWSLLSPGVGQLITRRILIAFFLIGWWIVVVYQSKLLPGIHLTALGQFEQAKEILDKQWVMNVPSIFLFGVYDAFVHTVEGNKLFEWEQARFLRKGFQLSSFLMPFQNRQKEGDGMYVVASFEHSIHLEVAVATLEKQGILKNEILAVPMDKRDESMMIFDRLRASDRHSMMDYPIIISTICALFGLIYGFLLPWGPVLWALIGTGVGFGVGILIKLLALRLRKEKMRLQTTEVVLLINCKNSRPEMVQDILWNHGALGVSKLTLSPEINDQGDRNERSGSTARGDNKA